MAARHEGLARLAWLGCLSLHYHGGKTWTPGEARLSFAENDADGVCIVGMVRREGVIDERNQRGQEAITKQEERKSLTTCDKGQTTCDLGQTTSIRKWQRQEGDSVQVWKRKKQEPQRGLELEEAKTLKHRKKSREGWKEGRNEESEAGRSEAFGKKGRAETIMIFQCSTTEVKHLARHCAAVFRLRDALQLLGLQDHPRILEMRYQLKEEGEGLISNYYRKGGLPCKLPRSRILLAQNACVSVHLLALLLL